MDKETWNAILEKELCPEFKYKTYDKETIHELTLKISQLDAVSLARIEKRINTFSKIQQIIRDALKNFEQENNISLSDKNMWRLFYRYALPELETIWKPKISYAFKPVFCRIYFDVFGKTFEEEKN